MTEARLKRMFAADGKCFDVAIDHGFFGEYGFLAGIEKVLGYAPATSLEQGIDRMLGHAR